MCAAVPMLALMMAPTAHAVDEDPPSTESEGVATLAETIAEVAEAGGGPEDIAQAASLPLDGGGALSFDADQRIVTTVMFDGPPSEQALAAVRAIAEIDAVTTRFPTATVRVQAERMPELAEVPGVISVMPALTPVTSRGLAASNGLTRGLGGALPAAPTPSGDACGPIPSEADDALKTALAREDFGVDGTGITIAIISDSFDAVTTPTSWADDVASGALPGAGNPCGRTIDVEILPNQLEGHPGSDEGRAMAQLVHGIAPGAKILFASSGRSEFEMAQNIEYLAEAGADVIVDDIGWTSETYYQKGFIGTTISDVVQTHGVAYFTAAGNATGIGESGASEGKPVNSWQTTRYRPTGCPAWVEIDPAWTDTADCLDFDPDPAVAQPFDTLSMRASSAQTAEMLLYGSLGEPLFGASTQYEVHFYTDDPVAPQLIAAVASLSAHAQQPVFPGVTGRVELPTGENVRMVMVRGDYDPAQTREPAVYLGFGRGARSIEGRTFMGDGVTDWVGEGVYGHAGDGSGISVASLDWEEPTEVREYSSLGPGTMLFGPLSTAGQVPAAPLDAPQLVDVPHVAGVDGMQTTFFGSTDGSGSPVYRFYGTSAAAPVVAAVAALGLSYNPSLADAEPGSRIEDLVVATARGTAEGGPVNPLDPARFSDAEVFGAGIADAHALLQRIYDESPAPGAAQGFTAERVTASSFDVSWEGAADADHYLLALYEGEPVEANALQESQVTAEPWAEQFIGLEAETRYAAQLTPVSELGKRGEPVTLEVTTAAAPVDPPKPTPTPTPMPVPAPDDEHRSTGSLSNTGGQSGTPIIIGAIALVLLGGGVIAVVLARRRRAAAAMGATDDGDDGQ